MMKLEDHVITKLDTISLRIEQLLSYGQMNSYVCDDATGQQNDATVINEDVVLKEATGGEISVSAPANDDAQAPAPEVAEQAAEERAAENNIGGQAEEDPAESEDSEDKQANKPRINIF